MGQLSSILSFSVLTSYLISAARGLTIAIPVAVLFELGGWLVRRWLLARLGPALARDSQREATVRARRRRLLRDYTVAFARLAQNTAAAVVILTLWRVDPVAPALIILALVLVCAQPLADALASWSLLTDDALAPGDLVTLNDSLTGVVVEVGPRRIKLRDGEGNSLWLRAAEVTHLKQRPTVAPDTSGPRHA